MGAWTGSLADPLPDGLEGPVLWITMRNCNYLHCVLVDKAAGIAGAKCHPRNAVPVEEVQVFGRHLEKLRGPGFEPRAGAGVQLGVVAIRRHSCGIRIGRVGAGVGHHEPSLICFTEESGKTGRLKRALCTAGL